MEKKLNKTVYLIDDHGTIHTDKTYKVIAMKGEPKDYLTLYEVQAEGEKKKYTAESWRCVVIPDNRKKDECERISKYLNENEVFYDGICTDGLSISIAVERGDWKHEHARLDVFMLAIGYELLDEVVTEEDGSDNYSSIHTFERVA